MTEIAKVTFSDAERQMLANSAIILTKVSALAKVESFLGAMSEAFTYAGAVLNTVLPLAMQATPKISKGEKLNDLPWLVLDYPRCFSNSRGHLAVRTLFWWGHGFNIQLHASGAYLPALTQYLLSPQGAPFFENWYVGLTKDAWNFKLPNETWQPLTITDHDGYSLKVAKAFGIDHLQAVEPRLFESFCALVDLIQDAFTHRGGETNL